ncbi:hypothetical protein A8709_17460 [Paenibacillus pectinilyticus]|uniref:Uncharacterized protein n=1 Tax=Paenibacillus pectinilyticus TaxID=512399 RepID=A0A1C0ZZD7_9BACL|nr:GerAB/ArcD/ProY family transporter [Paenibacillus pectinilyticus]OCT13401.1 hypothetical protein A8709_17460 [Paenibacillus pectinilyticus]
MDKSSSVVLMYILIHLGIIFFTYPEDIIATTGSNHWIVILTGIILQLVVIFFYMKGLSFFPGKDIIQIYLSTGKVASLLFFLPIFLYLLMTSIITLRSFTELIAIVFLSNTPIWAILFILLFVSTYLGSKGVGTIFRTGNLLGILFLPLILIICFIAFQHIDWYYAVPLFERDFSFLTKPTYYRSLFAFSGGFLFLGFVQPFVTYQRKKILLASLALIPFYILSVYLPILTFGEATAVTLHYPFVVVIDTINISWFVFDRVTMFFLFTLSTFIMLFISLTLWNTNRMISTCLPFFKPNYLMLVLSVIIFISCMMIPDLKKVEQLLLWNTPLRIYILVTVPLSIYFLGLRAKRKVSHAHN